MQTQADCLVQGLEDDFIMNAACCTLFKGKRHIKTESADSMFFYVLEQEWQPLDRKSVILVQNLITEQMNNSFHKFLGVQNLSEQQTTHFKLFLNTLEILCHNMGIIKQENYNYRTKDYGKYEVYMTLDFLINQKVLTHLPRSVEKGSFVNFQTYKATQENEVSIFMKKKFESMMKQNNVDSKISECYRNYAFYASQYQRFLREILFELQKYNKLLTGMLKDLVGKENKINDAFYVQGLIHPKIKQMTPTKLHFFIVNFEQNIRMFEQARIEATCIILDLYFNQATSTPQFDIRSNEVSRIDLRSNPTSVIGSNNKPYFEDISRNPSLNKILSESVLSFKSSMQDGKIKIVSYGSDNNFSNLFSDRESMISKRNSSLSYASKTLTQQTKQYFELNPKGQLPGSKKKTAHSVLKNKDYGFYPHFGTDVGKYQAETPTTVVKKTGALPVYQAKRKRLFTSSGNKENDFGLSNNYNSCQLHADPPKVMTNNDSQIKNFFKENKFYKSRLNNPSHLLKLR